MRRLLSLLVILLALSTAHCGDGGFFGGDSSQRGSDDGLLTLSTDSLSAWLQNEVYREPLLLDARPSSERDRRPLPGAYRITPEVDDFVFLENVPHDTPIVLYGSSDMGRRLQAAGYTNVLLLRGSLRALTSGPESDDA